MNYLDTCGWYYSLIYEFILCTTLISLFPDMTSFDLYTKVFSVFKLFNYYGCLNKYYRVILYVYINCINLSIQTDMITFLKWEKNEQWHHSIMNYHINWYK